MSKKVPTFMYSEDYPEGKQFDLDAEGVAELEADGWVDNPAKVKGHPNYDGDGDGKADDGEDDLSEHADKLSDGAPANNLSRPVGLPRRKSASTLVNVDDGDIQNAKPAGRVRKPKTAKGDGKAATKAESVSGKTEEELPPRPGDASSDAKAESEADAAGEVRPMTAD